jgi:hypothetical protein
MYCENVRRNIEAFNQEIVSYVLCLKKIYTAFKEFLFRMASSSNNMNTTRDALWSISSNVLNEYPRAKKAQGVCYKQPEEPFRKK